MASFTSITVTVRMDNGELRAGLELRAITDEDERDLAQLIDHAKRRELFDEETNILKFDGLGGYNLYWPGIGVEDRAAFKQIPRGSWANGSYRVLSMSNPWHCVEGPDDLLEQHLCPYSYDCQICCLKKELKDSLNESAEFQEEFGAIAEELNQYKERYGELPIQNGGEEQIDEHDAKPEGEDLEVEYAGNEFAGENFNSLEYGTRRAQSAEIENTKLRMEIARLKRENKDLRNRLSMQRNTTSSPMTQITGSTRANSLVGNASDDSYSDSSHPEHGRGGKTRPGDAASSRSQPGAKMVIATGGGISGRSGHAKTTKGLQKAVKKRQRDTYERAWEDDDDSDEEPPFKRHRSCAKGPSRAVEDQKGGRETGRKTCGPDKFTKKKYQERSDDSDDESFIPTPQGSRPRICRKRARGSLAPKASQTIVKMGRRINNSQVSFLNTFGLDFLPSSSRNTPGGFDSSRAPSNTMSGFMYDGSDVASSETPEATSPSTAASATTSNTALLANTPQTNTTLTASAMANSQTNITSAASTIAVPTQTGTTLIFPTAANPTQIAITLPAPSPASAAQATAASRRAQGWTNAELQALIDLVRAHRNAPVGPNGEVPEILHDVRLFQLMSRQLAAQGIHRSAGACKNEWNRRGRQLSGIDNRKFANPQQMATSLQ